jgi:hypothetical protein
VSAPLTWYQLRWPREVEPSQVIQLFRLLASAGGTPIVIEASSKGATVTHRLAVPEGRAGGMVRLLRAALPGLDVEASRERPETGMNRAVELGLSTRRRQLRVDDLEGVSHALITALAGVGHDEMIGLQWVLVRSLIPVAVPNRLDATQESWVKGLLAAPFTSGGQVDSELRSALRDKQGEPGWRLAGRLVVRAESRTRQRQLIRQMLGALRSAEAPSVGFPGTLGSSGTLYAPGDPLAGTASVERQRAGNAVVMAGWSDRRVAGGSYRQSPSGACGGDPPQGAHYWGEHLAWAQASLGTHGR